MFKFEMPSVLKKTGLKLVTQNQTRLMEALFNRDESVVPCVNDPHFTYSMRWYIGGGYAVADFHVQEDIPVNRFVFLGHDASPPVEFCENCDMQGLVKAVEIAYQRYDLLAVWSSSDEDDLGYDPEQEAHDYRWLVPLTRERVERLPLERRLDALAEEFNLSKDDKFILDRLANAWRVETPDGCIRRPFALVNELLIGFDGPGWKVSAFWAARKGDPGAIAALKA